MIELLMNCWTPECFEIKIIGLGLYICPPPFPPLPPPPLTSLLIVLVSVTSPVTFGEPVKLVIACSNPLRDESRDLKIRRRQTKL